MAKRKAAKPQAGMKPVRVSAKERNAKFLIEAAAFETRLVAYKQAGAAWQAETHALAMCALVASMPEAEGGFNDADRAKRLLLAMPEGARRERLKAWFAEFSNVRFGGAGKVGILAKTSPQYKPARPAAANAKPFWTKPEAPEMGALDEAAVARIISALVKRYEDTPAEKRKLSPATETFVASLAKRAEDIKQLAKVQAAQEVSKAA